MARLALVQVAPLAWPVPALLLFASQRRLSSLPLGPLDAHFLPGRPVMGEQERGESLVFVTVERASGRMIGSTRFMNIDRANRRVEIGSTWIAPAWQRTAINTEAKYLMIRHAFERWGCIRVELKTDALNEKSRNAILRIGAKEEGTLRRHLVTWTGRVRDTVYFSILDSEWAEVKGRLEGRTSQNV